MNKCKSFGLHICLLSLGLFSSVSTSYGGPPPANSDKSPTPPIQPPPIQPPLIQTPTDQSDCATFCRKKGKVVDADKSKPGKCVCKQ
jgi:hypothetical protein